MSGDWMFKMATVVIAYGAVMSVWTITTLLLDTARADEGSPGRRRHRLTDKQAH